MLVDQARDGSAALDHGREVDRLVGVVQRWFLVAGLVSPMGVVVLFILGQHPPQVPLTIDQQVVEALAPQCADESLGVAVRARRSRRGLDDPYALLVNISSNTLENLPSRSLMRNLN